MATEKMNWFSIWYDDKQSMLSTMMRNMSADLENGYDPMGYSIQTQLAQIRDYSAQFDREMQEFRTMEESKIQHWCYYDLKRRGVIG